MSTSTCLDIDPVALTFSKVLADKARRVPDKLFLRDLTDDRSWTYRQFDLDALRMANGFADSGLTAGNHVGVMMENSAEQLLCYFSLARLGCVTVPLNTAARGDLLIYFMAHADCSALIVDESLLDRVIDVVGSLPLLRRIYVLSKADRGVDHIEKRCAPNGFEVLNLREMLEAKPSPLDHEPAFSDLAFLMFTSGTTGPSKATMYTQAHALFWGWDYGRHLHYSADDIVYVYLPLFHGNGWLCTTLGALMVDASVVLARRFSASRFWSDVVASGATVTNCLGAVASFLWTQPPGADDRNHRMRRMGVSPVPEFGAEFEQRFGVAIMSSYGLTDYCMATAFSDRHPRNKLGSAGQARRGVELRISDENDLPLPPGTPGEILIRSHNPWGASLGYYKMAEASLAARRNMWFHTGDRGYLDSEGYLYFLDRIKDTIRRRGENISAFEVERAVSSHPVVRAAAAYAVKADATEDEVAISVVLAPDARLRPEELIEHCKRNLAYFMVPRYVEFVDELPINLSQKIEKYKLRQSAQERIASLWDRVAAGVVIER